MSAPSLSTQHAVAAGVTVSANTSTGAWPAGRARGGITHVTTSPNDTHDVQAQLFRESSAPEDEGRRDGTSHTEHREHVPAWPLSATASVLRLSIQAPMFALLRLVAPTQVSGLELLSRVEGPVLFACNHTSHLDTPTFLKALPPTRRRRVVVAAAADYFFSNPWLGALVALGFNAFPFARNSCASARASLAQCSMLIESGWSILIYPEGTRTRTGAMDSFRPGLGMLAVSLKVPVVPVYTAGLYSVLPKGKSIPHPGKATTSFGEPLLFTEKTHFREATQRIEDAVRSLATLANMGEGI